MRTFRLYLSIVQLTLLITFFSVLNFDLLAQAPPLPIPPNQENKPPIPGPILSDTTDLDTIKRIDSQDSTFLIPPAEFVDNRDEPLIDYPKQILRKSLFLPGLGQYENQQSWKIPIIYGLLGGLGYYSVYLTKQYHDYRAAYYNAVSEEQDFIFGPTPERLIGSNSSQLKANRNYIRNRRDFMYVAIGLAYALNAVDAYVYAHLSSFDVSDDLSIRPNVHWDYSNKVAATLNEGGFESNRLPHFDYTLPRDKDYKLWNSAIPLIGFSLEF